MIQSKNTGKKKSEQNLFFPPVFSLHQQPQQQMTNNPAKILSIITFSIQTEFLSLNSQYELW